MLKTSKPTQEPAQSGRGGEGVNKVLQPAQSVRLKASINKYRLCHDAERYKILVSKIMCKFRTVVLTNLAAIA